VLALSRPVSELAALGVRRISIGSGLASVAWGAFIRAAKDIAENGSFAAFAQGVGGRVLNPIFAEKR
jgi:2-methylisocitrate lyase-like PEP mutase family enzyme